VATDGSSAANDVIHADRTVEFVDIFEGLVKSFLDLLHVEFRLLDHSLHLTPVLVVLHALLRFQDRFLFSLSWNIFESLLVKAVSRV